MITMRISTVFAISMLPLVSSLATPRSQHTLQLNKEVHEDSSRLARISQPQLCEDGTKQYSGYVPGSPLFFWFFESRSDPANDPLGVWLNGGPGSSSLTGMDFMGPCKVLDEDSPKMETFEWGWNRETNLLMIDNPKGTGFSKFPFPSSNSSYTAAVDLYTFLQSFLQTFPRYAHHELAINSLSYGGHYVPVYASYIMHRNAILNGQKSLYEDIWDSGTERSEDVQLNLRSVSVGNGWFATPAQIRSWIGFPCGEAKAEGVPMLLSEEECKWSWDEWDKCKILLESCEDRTRPSYECAAAGMFCVTAASYHYSAHGYNPYDYRITEPYPEAHLTRFYNNASVQYQLGVVSDPTTGSPVKWDPHSAEIGTAFQMSADFYRRTDFLLERLLRSGLDVLIYEGMVDWICNWIGMRDVMSSLPSYTHQEAFNNLNYTLWTPFAGEGRKGAYKCLNNSESSDGILCYLEMDEAGHSIAHDKPREANLMVSNWMTNRRLE